MRPELQEAIKHTEIVDEYELGETVRLCAQAVQSHWRATHERFDDRDEDDHEFNEALSDQNFRTAYEVQFIWQLGLWRLVAQFEGLLSQWFPDLASRRLSEKLARLRREWGAPSEGAIWQIREWMELRNTLSHRPVRAPTFDHYLSTADLEELLDLLTAALDQLRPHATGQVTGK